MQAWQGSQEVPLLERTYTTLDVHSSIERFIVGPDQCIYVLTVLCLYLLKMLRFLRQILWMRIVTRGIKGTWRIRKKGEKDC